MGDKAKPRTERSRLRRGHQKGHYDRDTINSILDAGNLAHVSYVDDGAPFGTPMLYWRVGNWVYWHGSTASRAMKSVNDAPVCLTVTHLDGIVLAKSAFHHSANFRSVMLFGKGSEVTDPSEQLDSLKAFMDQMFQGRWEKLRPVKPQEMKATTIVKMAIDECAAKVRTGPPIDDPGDKDWPIWTGVLPLHHTWQDPISAQASDTGHSITPDVTQHVGTRI